MSQLSESETFALGRLVSEFRKSHGWEDFFSVWQGVISATYPDLTPAERISSHLYKIGQDLELRLGIAQGEVAPPDYRDHIMDRIEVKFGSRYKFCQAAANSEAFLSQVLSRSKDFSMEMLQRVAGILELHLVLLPPADVAEMQAGDLTTVG